MWYHQVVGGTEDLELVEALLANSEFIKPSRYADQLAAYTGLDVRVETTERLQTDPVGLMDDLFRWLDVPPMADELPLGPRRNAAADRTDLTDLGRTLVGLGPYWRFINHSFQARRAHDRIMRCRLALVVSTIDLVTWQWLVQDLEDGVAPLCETVPGAGEWDLGYYGWDINRKGPRARGSLAPDTGATDSGRERR